MKFLRNFLIGVFSSAIAFAPALAGTSVAVSVNPSSLTRFFSSSTSDTVPSWATGAIITSLAGGGGGAGSATKGGGTGDGWQNFYTPVVAGSTLTITVGAGGGNNANGGNTTVTGTNVNLPTAYGGKAQSSAVPFRPYIQWDGTGVGTPVSNYIPSISMNAASAGSVTCQFYDGSSMTVNGTTYPGACNQFGKGGASNGAGAGGNATGYGAGGGSGSTTGGSGTPGFVQITYIQ